MMRASVSFMIKSGRFCSRHQIRPRKKIGFEAKEAAAPYGKGEEGPVAAKAGLLMGSLINNDVTSPPRFTLEEAELSKYKT